MGVIFGRSKAPPPGWVVFNGQLEPDTSVAGYHARGREIRGVCHIRDCRRRCHVDFADLMSRGLQRLSAAEVKRLMVCSRLGGCAMEFRETGGAGVRLSDLTRREHVAVRIRCAGCGKASVAHAEAVIARLNREGLGGAGTLMSQLPGLIRGACPACSRKQWAAEVLWQDPDRLPDSTGAARRSGNGASVVGL